MVSTPPTFPPNAQVDKIFAQWDKPDSPGFALAVSQADHVVYARGYGMADLDHDIAITPSTVFHACSLAKQFTALSILLLAPQVKLTDQVHGFIPQLKGVIPPITVGEMLHHISGIRDQWVLATLAGWILSDDTISESDVLEDLVPRMKTLNFSPGSDYSYSNTNYTLAGAIVRKVSGLSLAKFASQHIFRPLRMTRTAITETHGQIVKHRAYGYCSTSSGFAMRMPNYDLTGPTNLLTTVEDLMRWSHNFDLPTVGGAANLAAMQTTVPHSGDYGLGLFIRTEQGRLIVEHDGLDPGYRSHLIRYPDQKLAVALLGNVQLPPSILTGELVRSVAAIYLNGASAAARPSSPPTPPAFAPANLTDYPGRYYSDEVDNVCDVILDGSSIVMAHRKYDPATLTAVSTDTFRMENFSVVLPFATVQFSRDAKGKIDGFYIDDRIGEDRLRHFRFVKVP